MCGAQEGQKQKILPPSVFNGRTRSSCGNDTEWKLKRKRNQIKNSARRWYFQEWRKRDGAEVVLLAAGRKRV